MQTFLIVDYRAASSMVYDSSTGDQDSELISSKETSMSDVGIAGGRIRSFVERIEHIEAEIADLNDGKKEVLAEAKGEGFDVKVIREIIKLRKQDQDERDEQETLLDLYMKAMDNASIEEAQAA